MSSVNEVIEKEEKIRTSAGELVIQQGYIDIPTYEDPVHIYGHVYIDFVKLVYGVGPQRWSYRVLLSTHTDHDKEFFNLEGFLTELGLTDEEIGYVKSKVAEAVLRILEPNS